MTEVSESARNRIGKYMKFCSKTLCFKYSTYYINVLSINKVLKHSFEIVCMTKQHLLERLNSETNERYTNIDITLPCHQHGLILHCQSDVRIEVNGNSTGKQTRNLIWFDYQPEDQVLIISWSPSGLSTPPASSPTTRTLTLTRVLCRTWYRTSDLRYLFHFFLCRMSD